MRLYSTLWILVVLSLCFAHRAAAQEEEEPKPRGEARSSEYSQQYKMMSVYHSPKLQADLYLEWMYIRYHGRRVTFWGARIVGMDVDSPLRDLPDVQLGDVITRLDGMRIARGAKWRGSRTNGYYVLPEAERHYGATEVRWIRSGTEVVMNDEIDLGPRWRPDDDDDGPVRP